MLDRKTIIKLQKNITDCAIWFGEDKLRQFSVGVPTNEKDIVICDESSSIVYCYCFNFEQSEVEQAINLFDSFLYTKIFTYEKCDSNITTIVLGNVGTLTGHILNTLKRNDLC